MVYGSNLPTTLPNPEQTYKAIQALDFPSDSKAMKSAATGFLDRVNAERIPYFVEHVRYHLEHPEPTDEFAFVLDMILDGLSRSLAAEEKGA